MRKSRIAMIGMVVICLVGGLLPLACSPAASTPTPTSTTGAATSTTPTATVATPTPTAVQTVYKWDAVNFLPDMVPVENAFADEVFARSNGRLKITYNSLQALGIDSAELIHAIADGHAQMGYIVPGYTWGDEPILSAGELPFLFPSASDAEKAKPVLSEVYEKVAKKYNQIVHRVDLRGVYNLIAKRPVTKLEDFQGLKVRNVMAVPGELINSLGGTSIFLPTSETYSSIASGLIDGVVTTSEVFISRRFYEVAKHISIWDMAVGTVAETINKDAFEALPEDLKKLLKELGPKYLPKFEDLAWTKHQYYIDETVKKGVEVHYMEPGEREKLENAAVKTWDIWFEKTGPEGREVMDKILAVIGRK